MVIKVLPKTVGFNISEGTSLLLFISIQRLHNSIYLTVLLVVCGIRHEILTFVVKFCEALKLTQCDNTLCGP